MKPDAAAGKRGFIRYGVLTERLAMGYYTRAARRLGYNPNANNNFSGFRPVLPSGQ